MKTVVVVGNPKPGSRTAGAGLNLARLLSPGDSEPILLDVVDLGPGLLGLGDPAIGAAVELVRSAELIVVASPTFKATYSGLLKIFLDQFDTGTGLAGVVAVPLMLGAGPHHFMAPDLLLKPLLVELGAICPTPGLYQLDRAFIDDPKLPEWVARWSPVISALVKGTVSS